GNFVTPLQGFGSRVVDSTQGGALRSWPLRSALGCYVVPRWGVAHNNRNAVLHEHNTTPSLVKEPTMNRGKADRLLETTYSGVLRVDRAAGVIRGVKILGTTSRNGRTYTDAALEQAAKLYEGLGVNID